MKPLLAILSCIIIEAELSFAQSGWYPVYSETNKGFEANHFPDANTGYAVGWSFTGVFTPFIVKTTNAGASWSTLTTPVSTWSGFLFRTVYFTSSNTGFVGGHSANSPDSGFVLRTTDGGTTWTSVFSANKEFLGIHFTSQNTGYVVGGRPPFVMKTTDNGNSWVSPSLPVPSNYYLSSVHFVDANVGFVAGNLGAVIKTTNGGSSWTMLPTGTGQSLWGLYFTDANNGIVVGGRLPSTSNVIIRTTDGGDNWTAIPYSATTCALYSVKFVSPTTGFIVGFCSQILKTTNGGASWFNQTSPVATDFRTCSFTSASTGYIVGQPNTAGFPGYVLKTTDGGGPTEVEPSTTKPTGRFQLQQNYPNPFNPTTKIRFDVPSLNINMGEGRVRLAIYDIFGKEVTTLVNERLGAGSYEAEWSASNHSSGVYFYRLEVGGFVETKKLIVLR